MVMPAPAGPVLGLRVDWLAMPPDTKEAFVPPMGAALPQPCENNDE